MLTVESVIVRVIVHHGKAVEEESPNMAVPDWERICQQNKPEPAGEGVSDNLHRLICLGGLALAAIGFWGIMGWVFVRVIHLWR
jgi:hypothetical protein